MSQSNSNNYPYTSFNFVIAIENIEEAGFSEISGLNIEIETEEISEGGVNTFIHKLPKRTKYGNITLKKGITNSTDLYDWYMKIVKGEIIQKKIGIMLLDEKRDYVKTWYFRNAFPVKWIGPDLNSSTSNVAFESIEIAHSGLLET